MPRDIATPIDATPRCVRGESGAEAMLGRVLRGDPRSLLAEYPLVFAPGAPGSQAVLWDEHGRPVSACTLLVRDLHLGGRVIPVGLVGSVATDPTARGRGAASRVLAAAEEQLAADGCLLAMLWADDPAFYERRGYRRFGCELDLVLPRERAARLPHPEGVRPHRPDDLDRILELYEQHPVRLARDPWTQRALLEVPGVHTLVLEREGRVAAYACEGRGGDLNGVVHEWGGSPEDVLALCAAHALRREDPTVVLVPDSRPEHAACLLAAGADSSTGFLAMGKLLDPRAAAALLPGPPRASTTLEELFPAFEAGPLGQSPFVWGLDSF